MNVRTFVEREIGKAMLLQTRGDDGRLDATRIGVTPLTPEAQANIAKREAEAKAEVEAATAAIAADFGARSLGTIEG